MAITAELREAGRSTRLSIRDLLTTTPVEPYYYPCAAQQVPISRPPRPRAPQVTYHSAHPNLWNALPPEFVENITASIYKHLDYLDICRLALVSNVFAETATAYKNEVPKAEKQTAVMEAENYFFQHHKKANKRSENGSKSSGGRTSKQSTPDSPSSETGATSSNTARTSTPNYACYECCRLIQHSAFDQNQPERIIRHANDRMSRVEGARPEPGDQEVSPRRFCVECGVNLGFYRSGDQILTLSGQRLWVCGCNVVNIKGNSLSSRMCNRCGEQCLHSAPRRNGPYGPSRTRKSTARTGPY
ncbi:hypothetical protein F5X68DRAFT_265776 [Plectosphaerella plurivora]|uniref:F-box domain-containing protein n=1 Tax=Plectosphaerella plurivora TaxID=936078 RepID=A0A9P8V246_9PEZI|nr:hypothetical protein F5X68DRAFT_265776 [Plectosphaerella plurivora]